MGINDSIFGNLPNPKMERNDGVVQIVRQSPVGFDQHVLDNITYIHPLHEALIQSQLDHSPKRVPMTIHQLLNGDGFPVPDIIKKLNGDFSIGPN